MIQSGQSFVTHSPRLFTGLRGVLALTRIGGLDTVRFSALIQGVPQTVHRAADAITGARHAITGGGHAFTAAPGITAVSTSVSGRHLSARGTRKPGTPPGGTRTRRLGNYVRPA